MKKFEFDISKPKEVVSLMEKEFIPFLLENLPFLKDKCFIFVQGSVARGDTIDSSDIDLMIVLPQQMKKDHMDELFKFKAVVEENNVEIHFFAKEKLENPEIMWNDDVTLGTLYESIIVYDPLGKGKKYQSEYNKFPPKILEDKIFSAGQEIIKKRKLIKGFLKRGNNLGAVSNRIKILKLVLSLLALKRNRYYGKHLYTESQSDPEAAKYLFLIDEILQKIQTEKADKLLDNLLERLGNEFEETNLLPEKFFSTWKWSNRVTKYQISPRFL